jgi:hypothetical protein
MLGLGRASASSVTSRLVHPAALCVGTDGTSFGQGGTGPAQGLRATRAREGMPL